VSRPRARNESPHLLELSDEDVKLLDSKGSALRGFLCASSCQAVRFHSRLTELA